ncbi:MAG: kelch repeat-containing protein [Planctomycetota bacterium]|nr:kelch repeat-containing protein [Planctomycetota bacterium]
MKFPSLLAAASLLVLFGAPALAQAPGAHWAMTPTPSDPPLRRENPGAADATHMYVFGGKSGESGGVELNDLWAFDGATWTLKTADGAIGSPPARSRAGVTFNVNRNRLTVFGGIDAAGLYLNDVWEWDPMTNTWADRTPVSGSPSPRRYTALAFDYSSGNVLMFGGVDASGTHLNDTWTFDGSAWTQQTPSGPVPAPRIQHALVERADIFDVVLCCGQDTATGTVFDDTWTWSSGSWTLVPTATKPVSRVAMDAAYDLQRGRVVIPSGSPGPTGSISEFDTATSDWIVRPLDSGIFKVTRYFLAYVPSLGRTYKVGGQALNPTAPADKTYDYQSDFIGAISTSGSGCAGTAGVTLLVPTGAPWIGGTLDVGVANVAASELALMLVGFDNSSWLGSPLPLDLGGLLSAPGCLLQMAPDLGLTKVLGTGPSIVNFNTVLPTDTSFAGLTFYLQALTLDVVSSTYAISDVATGLLGIK